MDRENNFRTHFFSLIDSVGRRLKPKTILVSLPSVTKDANVFAAYTMAQGKRAGRKTDFSDYYHLDGLIVDRFMPPESGLVLFLPRLADRDIPFFPIDLREFSQWNEPSIQQVLVTNGRRWTAFVRLGDKLMARESYDLPENVLSDIRPDGRPEPPTLSGFEHFLTRALMSWKQRDIPDVSGTFFASYAKSRIVDFIHDGDYDRVLSLYMKALEERLGVVYSGFGGEKFALYHFMAAVLLDNVASCMQQHLGISPETIVPNEIYSLYTGMRLPKHAQELDHVRIVADLLRGNTHPDFIRAFCESFWKALTGDARACDGWNRTAGEVFDVHIDFLDKYLADTIPFFPGLGSEGTGWLDPRAGIGNLLAAALPRFAAKNHYGDVYAIEADPLKFQVLRLRVLAALAGMDHNNGCPRVTLTLGNPLHNPRALPRPTACSFWALTSDLRFAGERGIHVTGNLQLVTRYGQIARDGFGIRTFDAEDPFAQYAGLVEGFLQQQTNAAALLITPATWLEKDADVAIRDAFLQQAKTIAIHVLPDVFLDNVTARKEGSASIVLVKTPAGGGARVSGQEIKYKEDIGAALLDFKNQPELTPSRENRLSLRPSQTTLGYHAWPSLSDLTLVKPLAGPMEQRGFSLIRNDPDELFRQMRDYFNPTIDDWALAEKYPRLMADGPRYDAVKTRRKLLDKLFFSEERIKPYPFKPFDNRWAYLDELRPLFKEPASELQTLASIPGNAFLLVCEPNDRASSGLSAWFSQFICDYDFFAGTARHFPMHFHKTPKRGQDAATVAPNLSNMAMHYAHTAINPEWMRDSVPVEEVLWHHILAVLFTPAYINENGDALRRDWPRIPIPFWKNPAKASQSGAGGGLMFFASQGRRIAELLAMKPLERGDWPVLDTVAAFADDDGRPIHHGEWPLSPAWSVKSKINAVRPGKGETHERPYTAKEEDDLAVALHNYRIDWKNVREAFGSKTVDVALCEGVWWRNVPEVVWEFEIGGYKALRKWLSYRGANVFERRLSMEECTVFSDIARRLTILVLIGLALDYGWPRLVTEAGK